MNRTEPLPFPTNRRPQRTPQRPPRNQPDPLTAVLDELAAMSARLDELGEMIVNYIARRERG